MHNHFISNNLITKNQSGFRPNDSVTNELICLVDSIHSSLDINLDVHSVFLDMSKAFGISGYYLNLNKMEFMVNYSFYLRVTWKTENNESI